MTRNDNFGKKWSKAAFFWLKNARYHSFWQSFLPAALAAFFVSGSEGFSATFALLAIVGVVFAHLGANLLDDYFDYRCEAVQKRREMIDGGMRARSMKCRYLENGQTTLHKLLAAGFFFCFLATCCGAVIWLKRGAPIFIFAGIGAFLSFFYSAPPFRLSFRGLGEATVDALFGPTLMCGVAFSACGRFDSGVLAISVPIGLLVANILYTHSILDLEPDLRAGKRTFAAVLGTRRRAVAFSGVLLASIYLATILGVATRTISPTALATLATAPLAIALFYSLRLYEKEPEGNVERKFWQGPMEYWDRFIQIGIDWFMIRWYMSRNLLLGFTILLFIATAFDKISG